MSELKDDVTLTIRREGSCQISDTAVLVRKDRYDKLVEYEKIGTPEQIRAVVEQAKKLVSGSLYDRYSAIGDLGKALSSLNGKTIGNETLKGEPKCEL